MKHMLFLLAVLGLVVYYGLRDWFVALCVLLVFTAVSGYPELPRLTDIAGLNYWFVMLAVVLVSWVITRERPLKIPPGWCVVLLAYLAVELMAFGRTWLDLARFNERAAMGSGGASGYVYGGFGFFGDYIYVPGRFILLGFLFMDGSRTRRRQWIGLAAVMLTGLMFGLLLIKTMPLDCLTASGDDALAYRHRINRETGVHPNNIAVYLGSSFWMALATFQLMRGRRWIQAAALGVMAVTSLGLLYTHSRGGYMGFAATGTVLCLIRRTWRTLALMIAGGILVCIVFPSVPSRMLEGIGVTSVAGDTTTDMAEVSAGRTTTIWPAAIKGIEESPLVGHGLFGYIMSVAIEESVRNGGGEMHPHCAYLEVLLDVGIVGAAAVLAPFVYVLVVAYRLARYRQDDRILNLTGAAGLAAALTILFQGLTGQHFVLSEDLFFFWCVAGLVAQAGQIAPMRAARMAVRPRGAVFPAGAAVCGGPGR